MADLVLARKLGETAREYANACIAAFKEPGGVHAPTVVSACARMAGSHMFRSFALEIPGVEAGQPVLSVEADQALPVLLKSTAGILARLGVAIADTPPAGTFDGRHKPRVDFLSTQRLLESRFAVIQSTYGLTLRQSAQAAAIATAQLIHHFAKALEANAAFGIATLGFVEGLKTAPDSIADRDQAA